MIPIQLTLEGLYSYQERQTINFETLTKAGLFGIFGAVGSGKSSILEAITFALYGETERLNARDKRAYNMMNLKSNRSYIAFDFTNFENKKFRATREFKRNSKNFEEVKAPNVVFYEWKNDHWIPLESIRPEEIIGLSYANFKRTIIIPQGQFKEFIELGATERTNMMKEIFNLQRFDLQNNVSALVTKNKTELDQLEGQLKGFEAVTDEQIKVQQEIAKQEKEKFLKVETEFKKVELKYQQVLNVKSDFEILTKKKDELKILAQRKPEIDSLEVKIELFEKAFRIFNPLILEKKKLQKELSGQKEEQVKQASILKTTEIEFDHIKEQLQLILPKFEVLNTSKTKEIDLGLIVQMLRFSEEIKILKERRKLGFEKVKQVENLQKETQVKIKALTEKAALLKPQKLDTNLLIQVGNWFSEKRKLTEYQKNGDNKTSEIQKKIIDVSLVLKDLGITLETFSNDFQIKFEGLEHQKKILSEKRNHLEVQQKLAHFANELHEGKSCPLCGALEHPNIVTFDDLHAELQEVLIQIKTNEQQQKDLQNTFAEVEKMIDRKKTFEEQLKSEQEILGPIKTHLEQHQNRFIWSDFKSENEGDFEEKRKNSFEIEKQIEELNQEISKEQKHLEKVRENYDKFNKALEEFKLEEAQKETQIKTNQSNLKLLNWNDYQDKPIREIENRKQEAAEENKKTEQNHQQLTAKEKECAPKLAAQKAHVESLDQRILDLEKEIIDNENLLKQSLILQNFKTLNEVDLILAQNINVEETRNEINRFKIDFGTVKKNVEELSLKLKNFTFDEAEFSTVENQFQALEKDLKTAHETVVKINSEIERLEKEFTKKEALLNELAQLQKRADQLKVMFNLFKGAGFVQFVSSIYLRQLCDHANIRFHRMTRNQLSLQLNENNDFEIIDYLNEGRSRSVKTLSGGQAFQVSLSLALALAESVQSNASAEKNFFFIDEGFGTQDLDAVNVVFETLMGLQKENRIVGIISHVEELKEKMPLSLNITKDEERGSLIALI